MHQQTTKSKKGSEVIPQVVSNPLEEILFQNIFRDIFDPPNLGKTIWHIHSHAENPFFGFSADDIEIIDALLDDIQFQAENSPGQNEYTASQDENAITITKASDFLSTDYHLSYNKVSITVNDITIEWYFLLNDNDADVEGDNLKKLQANPDKPEILFEKNESNKVETYSRNNTGYVFWWSDGRRMDHGDVETFIKKKKKEGDQRFINDFPKVQPGEQPPTYTIKGRKQPYYAFSENLPDPLTEGENLKSELLAGNSQLESAYDGRIYIGPTSKGESVVLIKKALNQIYVNDPAYTQLAETDKYDNATQTAVKKFQVDNNLKDKSGIVGDETLKLIDEKLTAPPPITYTWTGPSQTTANPTDITFLATLTYAGAVITQPQTEPNQERISLAVAESEKFAKQNTAEQIFNTSFLNSVASMSDMDMKALKLDKRKQMIEQIAGFIKVGGTAETSIVRLIKTTPQGAESKELLDWLQNSGLLPTLDAAIDGDNYKDYQGALRILYFNSMSVEQSGKLIADLQEKEEQGEKKTIGEWAKEDHIFYWLSPGMFSQVFTYHVHRIEYDDMKINEQGKLTFTIQHTYFMTEPPEHIELDPYEMIMVKFVTGSDISQAKPGDIVFMPAINLLGLYHQQLKQETFAAIDAALLISGVGGVVSAGSKLARAIAILDVVIGAAALVINDYRDKIAETEGGRKFLKCWDTVNTLIAIYGITRAVLGAPKVFRNLKEEYKNFRGNPSKKLTNNDLEKIDQETSKVIQGADEVRLEQIKNATREERIGDLGKGPQGVFRKTEGEAGAIIEAKYGYFERYHNEDLDWVSLSGEYKGKTFDHFGLEPGTDIYHSDNMEDFLPSIKRHFQKADIPVLDTRFMRPAQKKSVLDYIDQNFPGREFALVE